MKIRTGFVSNSSSSSFVIGVAHVSEDKVKEVSDFIEKSPDIKYYPVVK